MSEPQQITVSAGFIRTTCELMGRLHAVRGTAPETLHSRVELLVSGAVFGMLPGGFIVFPSKAEASNLDWYRWYLDAYELELEHTRGAR